MQDDKNTVGKKSRFKSRQTRVVAAMLGLAFLCIIGMLSAAQIGRFSATLEKVGALSDFPTGSVTRIQLKGIFHDPNPRKHVVTASDASGIVLGMTPLPPQEVAPVIFLVNDPEHGLLALYARDPHPFSCWIKWEESSRRFVDPCGGSKYTQTGEYMYGPAPRGLDRFGVIVANDGEVLVNVNDYQQGPPLP